MADYKICRPPQKITTLGLGSCLGVVLYDRTTKLCGLAHVMLPDSTKISEDFNRMKFVDTCLYDMYHALLARDVMPENLVAKVAGGAKMFAYDSENEFLNVGRQNITAVHALLKQWSIPILSEDVGKYFGRTIVFNPANGELMINAFGIGDFII